MSALNGSRTDSERDERSDSAASLRAALCSAFLASYFWGILFPESVGGYVFVVIGVALLLLSVPAAATLHRVFAGLALGAFVLTVALGRFSLQTFLEGLPSYFGIVAVLLILSMAGYPLKAKRYEAQIRAIIVWLERRGARQNTTAGIMGQLLGSVLDVGGLVLVDVIFSGSPHGQRFDALKWAARGFSFVPLWSNLNVLTATAIVLTGTSYPALLTLTLPFVISGTVVLLFVAQRRSRPAGDETERELPDAEPLDWKAAVIVLYPVGLIAAVALVSLAVPSITLTSAIALTVVVAVLILALVGTVQLRRTTPISRLVRESRASLASSSSEFALFGSAGVLVVSLQSLGALAPLGELLSVLPVAAVPFALAVTVAVGFAVGIHVLPMILLIDAAFPLSATDTPALWAVAIMLGCQGALLMTPFSASVMMLTRITKLPHAEVGRRANTRYSLILAACAFSYLALLSLILSG